jgi:hypothetical protein
MPRFTSFSWLSYMRLTNFISVVEESFRWRWMLVSLLSHLLLVSIYKIFVTKQGEPE